MVARYQTESSKRTGIIYFRMLPYGLFEYLPWMNTTTHTNEEQAVSENLEELKRSLLQAEAHVLNLEKEIDKYTEEVRSQTCTSTNVKKCETNKIVQRSSTGLWSWVYSQLTKQKTEPDDDQITLKILEQGMRSSLQKNKESIKDCQKSLRDLSRRTNHEHQNQQHSGSKEANGETKQKPETSCSSLFSKLISTAEKKHVTFHLYCQQKSDLVQSIKTELSKQLRNCCNKYGIDLKEDISQTGSEIKTNLPVIVICLRASRLGPDFFDAVRGVTPGPNVAVLIVHSKNSFALPTERSDGILLEDECRKMGAIIDVAFMAGKGIYRCGMNEHAIDELAIFIKNCAENIKS